MARWEHVNFEAGEWLIPEENAKTDKPHIVYMATQVIEMFQELKRLAGGSELVLPGRSSIAKPFVANALNKALEGLTFDMDPLTFPLPAIRTQNLTDGKDVLREEQKRRERL